MITLDKLEALGADTNEGMKRCMDSEDFYLQMVEMTLNDNSFEKLEEALASGDLDAAFERAHALKGVLMNVSLTSLAAPVAEMTEELRARTQKDYSSETAEIREILAKYREALK